MEDWLTKLTNSTSKRKTNKTRATSIVRQKVERTTTDIHIKEMKILVMSTVL